MAPAAPIVTSTIGMPSLVTVRHDEHESPADRLFSPSRPWLEARSTALPSLALVWCEQTIVQTSSVFVTTPDIRSPHQRRRWHACYSAHYRIVQRRVARRFRFWWG